MKQNIMKAAQKRPYEAPELLAVCVAPTQMLAGSGDPEVHTTSSKANTNYDALTKEDKNYNVWDDDWSE